LQEAAIRLPGRIDSNEATYASVTDLASAMRHASVAHDEHEKRIGKADASWPEWRRLPTFVKAVLQTGAIIDAVSFRIPRVSYAGNRNRLQKI